MMLQHPGQVSASEVSASAIVPCLSPPGSLVFEDFANLTPFVKEELRFAIQNKHLCHRMSSALESVTVSGRPLEMSVTKAEVGPTRGPVLSVLVYCIPTMCQACCRWGAVWSMVIFIFTGTQVARLGARTSQPHAQPCVMLTVLAPCSAPSSFLCLTLSLFPTQQPFIKHLE